MEKMRKLEEEAEATQKLFESYGDLTKEIIFSMFRTLWYVVTFLSAAQKARANPHLGEKAMCNVETICLDGAREYHLSAYEPSCP